MNFLQKFNWKENLQMVFLAIVIFGGANLLSRNQKPLPENIEEEAKQKIPWLKQTTEDITEFMDDDDANTFVSVRSRSFFSYFASKKYDKDKLIKLSYVLKGKGWNQIDSNKFDILQNPNLPYTANYPIDRETIVLCKNGATLFIWTDNIIGKYDNQDSATFVYLDFDYLSPCYSYTPDKFGGNVQSKL